MKHEAFLSESSIHELVVVIKGRTLTMSERLMTLSVVEPLHIEENEVVVKHTRAQKGCVP